MTNVYWLLALQGVIGAFDTLYYHEWKAQLPAQPGATSELRIHALRDFLYAVLFGSLPWIAWQGAWAFVLAGVIVAEIVLTLTDFVVEIRVRKPLGDVFAGERITHAIMGIIYGSMIANLLPALWLWMHQPTGFTLTTAPAPLLLRLMLTAMAVGVLASGLRDLYAALRLPHGNWPWRMRPERTT